MKVQTEPQKIQQAEKVSQAAAPASEAPKPPTAPKQPRTPSNGGKRRIRFEVEAPPGSEVFVAGDFNRWDVTKHPLSDKGHPGIFRRQLYVEPGTVEYKFLVDGEWHIDAGCSRWSPNDFGTLNSVLHVR